MDFPSDTGTSDFQQLRAMFLCSVQRRALMLIIPPLVTCHLVLLKVKLNSRMHYTSTADIISSSPDAYDSLFCQSPVDASLLMKTPSPIRFSKRDPVQPHCPKQANQEMLTAGLVQSSCLLHPFNHPDNMDDRDLPPLSVVELDPFSEEYHQKLRNELCLETDECSDVHPAVLNPLH